MHPFVLQYFDRAAWAFHNANNDSLPLNVRSHLIAVSLHACQSLKESLDQLTEEDGDDTALATTIKNLPHTEVIENIRNMDLHGWPIPICDPKVTMSVMVSKPDKQIQLSSSRGVGVALQMDGVKPKVHRSRKNLKHAKVKFGGATVSYGCTDGKFIVHDFSTDKDYVVLDVLRSFLSSCQSLIEQRMPQDNGAQKTSSSEETPDDVEV